MEKAAYISLTYLMMYTPEDLGLSEDCSEKEFEDAVEKAISETIDAMNSNEFEMIPNDIEVEVLGW